MNADIAPGLPSAAALRESDWPSIRNESDSHEELRAASVKPLKSSTASGLSLRPRASASFGFCFNAVRSTYAAAAASRPAACWAAL